MLWCIYDGVLRKIVFAIKDNEIYTELISDIEVSNSDIFDADFFITLHKF
jgi:hypothetical protein